MLLKFNADIEEIIYQIADKDDPTIRLLIQDILCQNDGLGLKEAVMADMLRLVRPEDGWSEAYNLDIIEANNPEI